MQDILDKGTKKADRTGTGTVSLFGTQMRFDLSDGFPLLTTKRVHMKSIIYELLFFMQGRTSNNWLNKHGVKIWDAWADSENDLGPIYGWQWRGFNATHPPYDMDLEYTEGIDQLQQVLDTLKTNPDDRRMIVSAWNPLQIEKMALPPCHLLFQFYVANNKLSCQMYQRSCDFFLGVPFKFGLAVMRTSI
jgi:thymidylate synthase